MKKTIQEHFGTENIEEVDKNQLKSLLEGDSLISRIKYRKQVGASNVRPELMKGQIYKFEHESADHLKHEDKNPNFGFKCLHYSVSESAKFLKVIILNKSGLKASIRVKTRDGTALHNEDYMPVDKVLNFEKKDSEQSVDIAIVDDEGWEPDEDFFIDILDTETNETLEGADCTTKVTIIDDDKPGQVGFAQTKGNVLAVATTGVAEVELARTKGSDGVVKVEYETFMIDESEQTATENVDFVPKGGEITFDSGETS